MDRHVGYGASTLPPSTCSHCLDLDLGAFGVFGLGDFLSADWSGAGWEAMAVVVVMVVATAVTPTSAVGARASIQESSW